MEITRYQSVKFFCEWIEKTIHSLPVCQFSIELKEKMYANLRALGVTQQEIDDAIK